MVRTRCRAREADNAQHRHVGPFFNGFDDHYRANLMTDLTSTSSRVFWFGAGMEP